MDLRFIAGPRDRATVGRVLTTGRPVNTATHASGPTGQPSQPEANPQNCELAWTGTSPPLVELPWENQFSVRTSSLSGALVL